MEWLLLKITVSKNIKPIQNIGLNYLREIPN